jgi:hypothetical protein
MSYRIENTDKGVYESLYFVGDDDNKHPIEVWPHSPRYRFREIPYKDSPSYGSDLLLDLLRIYEKWRADA